MSTIYRAGVIGRTGKGDYGHGLDVTFGKVPNAKLVAISDDNPDGLVAAGKKTGVNHLYADYREMLAKEQLDLVCVAPRYVDCHAEMVIAAAEAGVKGIFCEKPLAQTLVEADAILAACAKSGTRLAVAHRRANPYEWHGKKLVDEGRIGKVQRMVGRGKGDHRAGGQDLFVLGTHILDSMRYFAGAEVAWAMGHVTQDGREVTTTDAREGDEGVGLLAGNALHGYYVFENGITAQFESTPVPSSGGDQNSRWFGFEVHGTTGILSLRSSPGGELYHYPHGMWIPGEDDPQWERILLDEWETKPDGSPRSGGERMHESNRLIVEELIQAIEEDRDVVQASSGHDARAALEMIMAVHESHRLQQRVTFPLKNRENPYQVWHKESNE